MVDGIGRCLADGHQEKVETKKERKKNTRRAATDRKCPIDVSANVVCSRSRTFFKYQVVKFVRPSVLIAIKCVSKSTVDDGGWRVMGAPCGLNVSHQMNARQQQQWELSPIINWLQYSNFLFLSFLFF